MTISQFVECIKYALAIERHNGDQKQPDIYGEAFRSHSLLRYMYVRERIVPIFSEVGVGGFRVRKIWR